MNHWRLIPYSPTAQVAEPPALTRACTLAERKTAIYRLQVGFAVGEIWKSRGFTSAGPPTARGHLVADLPQAIRPLLKLPWCPLSPTKKTRRAAKYAAPNGPPRPFSTQFLTLPSSVSDIIHYEANAPQSEKDTRAPKGAKQLSEGFHPGPEDSLAPFLVTLCLVLISRPKGHTCKQGVVKKLKDNRFCPGIHKISGQIISQYATCKCHQISGRNQFTLFDLHCPF